MIIRIDNKEVEVRADETLFQIARRLGKNIPSMCFVEGAKHHSSCMVCMVKNEESGQMIPSCSTYPVEGMQIDTESEEVKEMRRLALELLLSDHRADCEAPCSMVCPQHLDVEKMLYYWDEHRYDEARSSVASVLDLEHLACDDCKRPCEKACRRGTVDKHVEIVEIIHQLAASKMKNESLTPDPRTPPAPLRWERWGEGSRMKNEECRMKNENISSREQSKIHSSFGNEATILHSSFKQSDHSSFKRFTSRIGRFTEKEKEWLKVSVTTDSTCLHCACSAQNDCKLRQYATESGITSSRYGVASDLPFKIKKHVIGRLWFEPAKCIRCGLCVYNTKDAFTFKGRGFNMQVVIPNESREHVSEDIAKLCPTGALYLES